MLEKEEDRNQPQALLLAQTECCYSQRIVLAMGERSLLNGCKALEALFLLDGKKAAFHMILKEVGEKTH